MINAVTEDKERIIEILLLAFEQNKSVTYICGNDANRYQRIQLLMDYAYKVCNKYGRVLISEDKSTCALVLFPDKKRISIASLAWDFKLAMKVIGIKNIYKVLAREIKIKKHHPTTPFYYVWFIGVHPSQKGLGKGSRLLQEILEDAKQLGRPVYLETSTLENLPWYNRFGFNIYKELDFGFPFFLLKNGLLTDE